MKRRHSFLTVALAAILMLSLLVGCGGGKPSSSQGTPPPSAAAGSADGAIHFDKMTLQLGHVNPTTDDDQYHKFATNFAENISEATGGAVTVEIFGNSQLGGERDVIEGMQMGTMDIAIISNLSYSAVHKPSNMLELPFLFGDREAAYAFLDGPINAEISDALYQALDIKILGWAEGGFRNVLNNTRPIKSAADFSGVKIRVPESPMFIATFQALGANPTPVAFSETFTAIQQGTVDGLELPIPSAYTGRYYEINKYMSLTGHFYNSLTISMAGSMFDGLTAEQQQVFIDAAVKAGQDQRKFVQENDTKQLATMKESGCEINEDLDKASMQAAVQGVYDEYRDVIGAELYDKAIAAIQG